MLREHNISNSNNNNNQAFSSKIFISTSKQTQDIRGIKNFIWIFQSKLPAFVVNQ